MEHAQVQGCTLSWHGCGMDVHSVLSKLMMGCRKVRVIIFDTNNGAMVLTKERAHALSFHQNPLAAQRSVAGSKIGMSPRLMLKS